MQRFDFAATALAASSVVGTVGRPIARQTDDTKSRAWAVRPPGMERLTWSVVACDVDQQCCLIGVLCLSAASFAAHSAEATLFEHPGFEGQQLILREPAPNSPRSASTTGSRVRWLS